MTLILLDHLSLANGIWFKLCPFMPAKYFMTITRILDF